MQSGEYFRIDVDALTDAAIGMAELIDGMDRLAVEDIDPGAEALGHDGLAAASESFTARWAAGVDHLTTDGRDMADRMLDAAAAYIDADGEQQRKLRGYFEGRDDPGAEAIERDG